MARPVAEISTERARVFVVELARTGSFAQAAVNARIDHARAFRLLDTDPQARAVAMTALAHEQESQAA